MRNFSEMNPANPMHWQPVRFERRYITDTSTNQQLEVGNRKEGNVVLAIKFCNLGTNSKVFVGSRDGYEEISNKGDAEISFGTGWPHCIEDEFSIKFEKIDNNTAATHLCLVIETVLNC